MTSFMEFMEIPEGKGKKVDLGIKQLSSYLAPWVSSGLEKCVVVLIVFKCVFIAVSFGLQYLFNTYSL